MKKVLAFILPLFIIVLIRVSARANFITVCQSGACDSLTVQGGINLANNWDRVTITDSGDYYESLNISKTIFLTSNSPVSPSIFTNGSNSTIRVRADNVTISNLVIKYNGTTQGRYGIEALNNFNLTVKNNVIIAKNYIQDYGISIVGGLGTDIESNSILTNGPSSMYGIYMLRSNFTNIISNNITSLGTVTTNYGIAVYSSTNNNISLNNISSFGKNNNYGLFLSGYDSQNNYVGSNRIFSNGNTSGNYGIYLLGSVSNTIVSNTIQTGGTFSNYGISLSSASANIVSSNAISTNGSSSNNYGIYLTAATQDSIVSNIITTNGTSGDHGIYLTTSNQNNLNSNAITTAGSSTDNYGIFLETSNSNSLQTNTIFTYGFSNSFGINIYLGYGNTFTGGSVSTNANSSYGIIINDTYQNYFYNLTISAPNANDIFLAGYNYNTPNFIVNSNFNKSDISVTDPTVTTTLINQYYLGVHVQETNSSPIYGSGVEGDDNSGNATFFNFTNSQGNIPQQILSEFMTDGQDNPNYLYFTSYRITASALSHVSRSVNTTLTSSQILTLTLPPVNTTTPLPQMKWYDFPTSIEINQSNSTSRCINLTNSGQITANNVSISAKGVSYVWYTIDPNSFSTIPVNQNKTVCLNFTIPATAIAGNYIFVVNVSEAVSEPLIQGFPLIVDNSTQPNPDKDAAQKALDSAYSEIMLAFSAGKNVTEANNTYQQALNYFNQGQYPQAKDAANNAYNLAFNLLNPHAPGLSPIEWILFLVVVGFVVIIVSITAVKSRSQKKIQIKELKEKWSESVKARIKT